MGVFDIFKRKNADFEIPARKRAFMSEEDLEEREVKSLETKIRRSRLNMLKKRYARLQEIQQEQEMEEEIRMLEEDIYGSDEEEEGDESMPETPEAIIMQMLTKKFGGMNGTPQNVTPPQQMPPNSDIQKREFTNEELEGFKAQIPKPYLKKLQAMSDDELLETMQLHQPDFYHQASDDSIKRAVQVIRG